MKPKKYAGALGAVMFAVAAGGACIPDGAGGGDSFGGGTSEPPQIGPSGGFGGRGGPPQQLSGSVVVPSVRPPAVSGGTLLVLRNGTTAVASDSERDAVFIVDLVSERLLRNIPLSPGDEPGRLVEAANGQVLVALRNGGAVVRIDVAEGVVAGRTEVCAAPRGVAFQPTSGLAFVACAGGELVSLTAADLTEKARVHIDHDLRDVVVNGNNLFVSRFRSAELLTLSIADLKTVNRRLPPGSTMANLSLRMTNQSDTDPGDGRSAEPQVAWRMRGMPDGSVRVLHQESSNGELGISEGGYAGGGCGGPVGASVAAFRGTATPGTSSGRLPFLLTYDFDVSADGKRMALVTGGDTFNRGGSTRVMFTTTQALDEQTQGCSFPSPPTPGPEEEVIELRQPAGESVAVAFDGKGRVVVQTREPARIEVVSHRGGSIKLSDDSRADTGQQVFHMATDLGLACASCHPEGGDDGHVWRFQKLGLRRTQNLLGGISATAPFHWDGEMRDFGHLMQEVFTGRMRGPTLRSDQVMALQGWVDRLPPVKTSISLDPAAADRGHTLFNDAKVACASCHKGALFTDNSSRTIGKGAMTQVPGLRGVSLRAPYMHDGCAKTLLDRFTPACGGGDMHGVTSQLTPAQLQDLVAYLETL